MLVILGRLEKSVDQPNGHWQSLTFSSSVAVCICRLSSLCIIWCETGNVCTSNPWKTHPQLRFEINVIRVVGRNCLSVSDWHAALKKTFLPRLHTAESSRREAKCICPEWIVFFLKSMFLTLCGADKDGCCVKHWKCGCTVWHRGAAHFSCVRTRCPLTNAAQRFLGNDLPGLERSLPSPGCLEWLAALVWLTHL